MNADSEQNSILPSEPKGKKMVWGALMVLYLLLSGIFLGVILGYGHHRYPPGVAEVAGKIYWPLFAGGLFSVGYFLFEMIARPAGAKAGRLVARGIAVFVLATGLTVDYWGGPSIDAPMDALAKAKLEELYRACTVHWNANGMDQECHLEAANRQGFSHSRDLMDITSGGTGTSFMATAHHPESSNTIIIDAKGNFTKQ